MYPPFQIPEVRTLNVQELNKIIRIINRAFQDIYRGTIYSISSMAEIRANQLGDKVLEARHFAPGVVTAPSIASGTITSAALAGSYQISGVYLTSSAYQVSGIYQASGVFQVSGVYLTSSAYQVSGIYQSSGVYETSGIGVVTSRSIAIPVVANDISTVTVLFRFNFDGQDYMLYGTSA